MRFATSIVPMPHWSTPLGCTKLFLIIVVLVFISVCVAIWGWYAALSTSIFSAVLSLLAFGYYMTALSFKPSLYNKWIVLSLETILTLLWFTSLILLAGWTGASSEFPRYYYNLSPYPTPYGSPYDSPHAATNISRRSLNRKDLLSHFWQPFGIWKRQDNDLARTEVRIHGMDAHYTAQILAGISAGLAGMIFIMYAITLTTFTMNFHHETHTSNLTSDPQNRPNRPHNDVEMQMQRPRSQNANTTTANSVGFRSISASPTTVVPLALTKPLRVDLLPRDFDSESQRQNSTDGHFPSTEEAMQAGIKPPTPVMRALKVEEEKNEESERGRSRDCVSSDGRIEREV